MDVIGLCPGGEDDGSSATIGHPTAIDIHKRVFQAAVVDLESRDIVETRFSAHRESRRSRADQWCGRVDAVAIDGRFSMGEAPLGPV